jgi:hypothetical protein
MPEIRRSASLFWTRLRALCWNNGRSSGPGYFGKNWLAWTTRRRFAVPRSDRTLTRGKPLSDSLGPVRVRNILVEVFFYEIVMFIT